MKLTFITLFLSTTGMFASVNSQNTRVNIHVNNANTQIVLNEIEKQTDYLFVYDTKEIDLNRKVSVEAQNKTVADVLSSVFTQTDISYAMEGNNIMLMRKNTSVTQQSNRRITGVVKDAIGEPIIGANIVEKGTTNGIITDINGNFSLMVSENAILQISYIGYQTQEIPTKGQTNIQITMKDDAQALDDVVVIGYGTQRNRAGRTASYRSGRPVPRPRLVVQRDYGLKDRGISMRRRVVRERSSPPARGGAESCGRPPPVRMHG